MTTGGCFCGAIRFNVTKTLTGVTYCHCSKCRKWHGHAGAWTAVDRDGLELEETRSLKWHKVSDTVRRGFCENCGSTLFFDESPDAKIGITAGSLNAPTGTKEKAHIYVGSKGDYYELNSALPAHETFPQRPK